MRYKRNCLTLISVAMLAATACVGSAIANTALPSAGSTNAQSIEVRSRALNSLFSEYWQTYLRRNPEQATAFGDKRYNDRWSDLSAAGRKRSLREDRDYIKRVRAIDITGVSEEDKLSAELLLRALREDQESARFKEWEMPINQIHGLHYEIAQLVATTPFDDKKDYDNYVSRLRKVPRLFSQLADNMRQGIADGRTQPKLVAEKVLAQVRSILAIEPDNSPFVAPIRNLPAGIEADAQRLIARGVNEAITRDVIPAYQRLAKFLETEYVPKARSTPGIWAIPDGDAYYSFCIRRNTTLEMSAEEIHQVGLNAVNRDESAMFAIANKQGYRDLASFNAAIRANVQLHATSKEQLLDLYRSYLEQIQARLPELFASLPRASLIVEATPAYTERQRPGATYEPGTPDGKRPGRVVVNAFNVTDIQLGNVEAVAYHEGTPGHHLQFSIAQELTGLPEFRRYGEYTAYTEGWALYAEQLGKELGFYQDPYSDYGRLQSDVWRSIRLVVDTGLHSKHWTRQQVVDFFHEHSSVDETNVQRETDRYIAWPGQAMGYKIGQLELLGLRQRAQTELAAKFDIKTFHGVILDSGAVPLDVLDTKVAGWIASQK